VLSGVNIDNSGLLFIQLESNASLLGLSGLQIVPVPVPVPAAVWLFGSGLIGLIGMRKNTSKATGRKPKKQVKDSLKPYLSADHTRLSAL